MSNARYLGRVAAVAIALSVGSGVAATTGMATAQADSALDKLRPNISVSAGGKDIIRSGSATATSNGKRSVAIAVGKDSVATATGGVQQPGGRHRKEQHCPRPSTATTTSPSPSATTATPSPVMAVTTSPGPRAMAAPRTPQTATTTGHLEGNTGKAIAGCAQTQTNQPSVGCSSEFTGNNNNVARATDNARALQVSAGGSGVLRGGKQQHGHRHRGWRYCERSGRR